MGAIRRWSRFAFWGICVFPQQTRPTRRGVCSRRSATTGCVPTWDRLVDKLLVPAGAAGQRMRPTSHASAAVASVGGLAVTQEDLDALNQLMDHLARLPELCDSGSGEGHRPARCAGFSTTSKPLTVTGVSPLDTWGALAAPSLTDASTGLAPTVGRRGRASTVGRPRAPALRNRYSVRIVAGLLAQWPECGAEFR